jgi:hypothetical protein
MPSGHSKILRFALEEGGASVTFFAFSYFIPLLHPGLALYGLI